MGNRRNRRQRFAAEPQRPDAVQVARCADLAGGVAQKRPGRLVRRNAAAVVRHPDVFGAAALDLHRDGSRASINRVFNQLFEHRRRTFNHLARSNQFGNFF